MKKLIMAVAIVCAAAAAQAATFSWTTTANQMGPNIDLANLVAGHYGNSSSALKNMSAVTWTYTMALDNGTATDNLSGSLAYQMSKINVKNLSSDVVFKPESGKADNDVDYSIIIVGTYKDSKNQEWTITSDAIEGTQSFSSLSDLVINSPTATGWTVAAVPEPTSGLLLLLGMAGLALRRRRA